MAIDWLSECRFLGPALPEPFVAQDLEAELRRAKLLAGDDVRLQESFAFARRKLADLGRTGGPERVLSHVTKPLAELCGYTEREAADDVSTSLEIEPGGTLLRSADGAAHLRVFAYDFGDRLDAPSQRGLAYRYAPVRIAGRVLRAKGERLGLVTNGEELRLVLADPARPDSEIVVGLDRWRTTRKGVAPGFRLVAALVAPAGVAALPEIVEKARIKQTKVTKDLRDQAKRAIADFLQSILDAPENAEALADLRRDPSALARSLWREGLIVVYRLLFILKLEASDDPARVFKFAASPLWRKSFSPSQCLYEVARRHIETQASTGRFLEDGLRRLFALFEEGIESTELTVKPLGGALFGPASTPLLSRLRWPDHGIAQVLDHLLLTRPKRGAPMRVHYGPLDVEDLGRVYEALLEQDPGIATEPMVRLRRAKLEVVVPAAQGEPYRPPEVATAPESVGGATDAEVDDDAADPVESDEDDGAEEEKSSKKESKVEWIEPIPPGRFFLRVGLGRKSSGSYYTPHSFVRFLVQETLGPKCEEVSPSAAPVPAAILRLKVLDPAMGSGHFLVEACRHLGGKLYEACRAVDELATKAETLAESKDATVAERRGAAAEAVRLRADLAALPDPDGELIRYLPSRTLDGSSSTIAEQMALAICRRLVAVHCLYGVDKNPLAVELAKLALWLESHAEGFPLTFVDHRLLLGDSLTGPFIEHLFTLPLSREPLGGALGEHALTAALRVRLADALANVRELERKLDVGVADLEAKAAAHRRLRRSLAPFRILAAGWSGFVMDGGDRGDEAYRRLVDHVLGQVGADFTPGSRQESALETTLIRGVALGLGLPAQTSLDLPALLQGEDDARSSPAVPFELAFPEVFHPSGEIAARRGFDVVLGNPPWEAIQFKTKEFFAAFDFSILAAPTKRERERVEERLLGDAAVAGLFNNYKESFEQLKRANDRLYEFQKVEVDGDLAGRQIDAFRVFMERGAQLLGPTGSTGVVVPSAFHANEGATGVRRLYLEQLALKTCFSFENRRSLFEIHKSFKFAVVVAVRPGPTQRFACQFYLHDDGWLFGDRTTKPPLSYDIDFVRKTGGDYLCLLELRSNSDFEIADVCFKDGEPFGDVCERLGVRFGSECHMANDAWRFTPAADILAPNEDPRDPEISRRLIANGCFVLHEGKTFHQFTDRWGDRPRYIVATSAVADKPDSIAAARHYRLAYRAIARSTDERTVISVLLPPGTSAGHSASIERAPTARSSNCALWLLGVLNSFQFDWLLRQSAAANVTKYLLDLAPLPGASRRFFAHAAIRISCNNVAFAPLWHEQLSDVWREPTPPFTWPVLKDEDSHWRVRAAIDAVVASAYGLTRTQYAHVLSTFSHKSYPAAPKLCLAAFDELLALGLEAFTRKHDPYHDVPLNESLPKPVIDIPIPALDADATAKDPASGDSKLPKRRRSPRSRSDEKPSIPDAELPFEEPESAP